MLSKQTHNPPGFGQNFIQGHSRNFFGFPSSHLMETQSEFKPWYKCAKCRETEASYEEIELIPPPRQYSSHQRPTL